MLFCTRLPSFPHTRRSRQIKNLLIPLAVSGLLWACGSNDASTAFTTSSSGAGGDSSSSVATGGATSNSGGSGTSTNVATVGSGGSTNVSTGAGGTLDCNLEQVTPKKVYHIGHSLIDRTDRTFNNLVEEHTGQSIDYFTKSIPGSPLHWHWSHPADGAKGNMGGGHHPLDLLKTGQFDVLSMTESIPPNDESHIPAIQWVDTFINNATTPTPEVFIYSTWDRRKTSLPDDAQSIQEWMQNVTAFQVEWEAFTQKIKDAHPTVPIKIIPVGLVLKELQQRVLDGTLTLPGGKTFRETFFKQNRPNSKYGGCDTIDHIHLSKTGIYTSAVTHYTAIFGSCPVGLPTQVPYSSYNDGCITDDDVIVDTALAAVIQEVAWEVLSGYAWSGVGSP